MRPFRPAWAARLDWSEEIRVRRVVGEARRAWDGYQPAFVYRHRRSLLRGKDGKVRDGVLAALEDMGWQAAAKRRVLNADFVFQRPDQVDVAMEPATTGADVLRAALDPAAEGSVAVEGVPTA